MSRGGANPNWEYQLVDLRGHTSDAGLRHRNMITRGHQQPTKAVKQKARKRVLAKVLTLKELKELFE